MDGNDKFHALECTPICQFRRKEYASFMTSVEKRSFSSINCSIVWLGTTVSVICSEFATLMHRKAPTVSVWVYIEQLNGQWQLKCLETITHYPTIDGSAERRLSIVVFSDAVRYHDCGQSFNIIGLLIYDLSITSISHDLACSSHRAKRLWGQ